MQNSGPIGTFLLGMGAQKAGTSWLHTYFRSVPEFSLGFQKEYHIFDALYREEFRGRYDATLRDAAALLASGNLRDRKKTKVIKRAAFLADVESYFDYYEYLLLKRGGGAITTDMTPSHSALPVDALERIKTSLEQRRMKVKVIFLMRDPVERCLSALRMARRDGTLPPPIAAEETEEAQLLKLYMIDNYRLRTNYHDTIRHIEQVFAPEDVLYGFYETLFDPAFIQQVADFLGFAYIPPKLDEKVNASAREGGLGEAARVEVAEFYRDVYTFCRERFGSELIGQLWPNDRFVS